MKPARLQQALARAGVASRRAAEKLILSGRVTVNGVTASLGMRVNPLDDVIAVDRQRIAPAETVWIALHKPVGYIVSRANDTTHKTVFELVPSVPGLTYVGRLDVMTSGLLLFTNDGAAANRLTHPRYGTEREYRARVHGRAPGEIRAALQEPIIVERRPVRILRSRVRPLGRGVSEISLVLSEGRHRIVRRTCDLLGLKVDRLQRLSHGPVSLGSLPPGRWRYLTEGELEALCELSAA
jgi:23S rRNA pseudouridine2605 synthase